MPADAWFSEGADRPVPSPRCFAYSAARRAYACVAARFSGRLEISVDAVGLGPPRLVRRFAVDRRIGPKADEVARKLAGLGFQTTTISAQPLATDRWVSLGDVALRYRLETHVAADDVEYFGTLALRCPSGKTLELDLKGKRLVLGPRAMVFRAPDARAVAISVHGVEGPADKRRHWISTVVVDTAADCTGGRAMAGPVPDIR